MEKQSKRIAALTDCLDFAQSPRAHREHDALSESAKKRKKSAEEEEKKFGEKKRVCTLYSFTKKKIKCPYVYDNSQIREGSIRTITDRTERFNEIRRD